MADLLFPPHACISAQRVDVVSNTASARSIFTGAIRTVDRGGDRFRWSITRSNASDRDGYAERAILKAFLAQARGQANRVWFSDPAYVQRGSFPSQELLSNNTFTNGTTGWSSASSNSISVSDRILRSTRVDGVTTGRWRYANSISVSPYAPYAFRVFAMAGRGAMGWAPRFGSTADTSDVAFVPTSVTGGLLTATGVPWGSAIYASCVDAVSGRNPGDFMLFPFSSLARCALIDNGPNILLRSDELDNASWTKTQTTVTANATTAPDGASTADSIIEDSGDGSHFVGQTVTTASDVGDFAFSCALKAGARSWARLHVDDTTHAVYAYFNLATGAIGATGSQGANFINQRSYITALGDGWYHCTIVGRKTSASTSVRARVYITSANNTPTHAGDGTSNIYAWRATLARSSVPTRLVQTTTSASTGTSQTGNALYVKGLPASTNGLLLPGDRVQIGNQLCEVVAPLNSDAAGLGYLQLAWPLRTPPADNAPVIINNPMARCILTSNEGGWSDTPGGFSEFDFQLEEALDE